MRALLNIPGISLPRTNPTIDFPKRTQQSPSRNEPNNRLPETNPGIDGIPETEMCYLTPDDAVGIPGRTRPAPPGRSVNDLLPGRRTNRTAKIPEACRWKVAGTALKSH